MTNSSIFSRIYILLIAALAVAAVGCSTAGGKQETAIGHNSLGRDLKGNVTEVTTRSQNALKEMGVQITDSSDKNSGTEKDLNGKSGAHRVSVQINDIGNGMSHVEVSAKDGEFQWNQDYAQSILEKIISKS